MAGGRGIHALAITTFLGAAGTGGVGVRVGVGVGGGIISGNPLTFPLTVAYCPHSQQVPEPPGVLMIQ